MMPYMPTDDESDILAQLASAMGGSGGSDVTDSTTPPVAQPNPDSQGDVAAMLQGMLQGSAPAAGYQVAGDTVAPPSGAPDGSSGPDQQMASVQPSPPAGGTGGAVSTTAPQPAPVSADRLTGVANDPDQTANSAQQVTADPDQKTPPQQVASLATGPDSTSASRLTGAPPSDGGSGTSSPPAADTTASPPAPNSTNAKDDGSDRPFTDRLQLAESGSNPNAKNPLSSASGPWQITDGTLQTIQQNHPELANAGKNDPRVRDALLSDNQAVLAKVLGRAPSDGEQYSAWLLGADGASKFLTADPNASVASVVSAEAIANNKGIFTDAQGKPLSVSQAYANITQRIEHPGTGSTQTASTAPDTTGTTAGPSIPSTASAFQSQADALKAYIASQPAMWDKLQQMQQQYMQATKPSFFDTLNSGMNQYAQQMNAANANRYATAGGVLLHALPNAQPMQEALSNSAQQQMQERLLNNQRAQVGFQTGSDLLQGQQKQAGENLALQGGLANTAMQYNVEQQKLGVQALQYQLERAKFGQQTNVELDKYIADNVSDPVTRAAVTKEFYAGGGNPTASLAQNVQAINAIIAKHAQAGENISTPQGQYVEITGTDPNDPTHTIREVADRSTPAGRAQIQNAPSWAKKADLGAPSVNVGGPTVNSGEGSGGGKEASDSQQWISQQNNNHEADYALKLLQIIKANGGTSKLTQGDIPSAVLGAIKNLTGLDPLNNDVRTLYTKMVARIQSGNVMEQLKGLPRPSEMIYNQLQKGQVGADYPAADAEAFLNYTKADSAWQMDFIKARRAAIKDANLRNDKQFDPEDWAMSTYFPAHPPPTWDLNDVMEGHINDLQKGKGGGTGGSDTSNQTSQGGGGNQTTPPQGGSLLGNAIDWMRRQVGAGPANAAPSPVATPQQMYGGSQPAPPAPPAQPGQIKTIQPVKPLNVSPDQRRMLQGG
jgi:hypothetical protein